MKKFIYITAVTMTTMVMTAVAMAGSVDIGLGRMDQAEFESLQQMVSGSYHPSASASASTIRPQDTRVAEFNQADVDGIRQAMVAGAVSRNATESIANNGMVDIGTGSMATSEFCNLNKLVASNNTNSGFAFICP
ncbi:hypothetical protein [uncultured Desulfosarcina sp.]|uniref:hypothetical protein n=1 Tax=uncultured Desulfosarcina sp. TaxID=218289 RepID=UPI0029C8E738|nr:hypothetical protein [uncultured Desulfosarcina sp.]